MSQAKNHFIHFLVFLLLLSWRSYSQESVHEWIGETTYEHLIHHDLPVYRFRFIEDTINSIDNRIEIVRHGETTFQQMINNIPIQRNLPAWSKQIVFVDMNFDDYIDLKLIHWMGTTGNTGYHFWLFDRKTDQFEYNNELSQLSNPEADPATRLIYSHSRGGMVGQIYITRSHLFAQEKLVLMREEKQDWVEDKKCFQRITKERIDERMIPVSEGVTFDEEVKRGDKYFFEFTNKMIFELKPIDYGWEIVIRTKDRPEENLARLTPLFHFTQNPRYIAGWHFRNADNTGPNEGSVNTPREAREFIFSPKVGLTIQGPESSSNITEEEVNAVRRDGKGTLIITDYQLGNLQPQQKAYFQSMKFRVNLNYEYEN